MQKSAHNHILSGKRQHLPENGEKGFTLLELLIAMAIMAIAAGAMLQFFSNMSRANTTSNVRADVNESLMMGMDYMVRDIRRAGFDPKDTAKARVITLSNTTLRYTIDLNRDGDTGTACTAPGDCTNAGADPDEDITYTFDAASGTIIRTDTNALLGPETLLSNVDALGSSFGYFDANGALTTSSSDLRTIMITIKQDAPAARDTIISRRLTRRIMMRNLF